MPATGRLMIEPYDVSMKRFDKKLEREYRFIVNPEKESMMRIATGVQLI